MFCTNCGKQTNSSQKFCTSCGAALHSDNPSNSQTSTPQAVSVQRKNTSTTKKVVWGLVILAFIGFGIYNSLDEDSITQNNEGLTSFESGDSQTAINQLQQASQDAVTNETRINTLKNLGYVYATESKYSEALSTFREALKLTEQDSFDYYLISGEIALLEYKPNAALLSFNKAYELNPTDFQVNNSLALFYIDLEEVATQYVNYPKALTHAKIAYENDAEKSEISRQNLGLAYYFNDNYDQAISLFSQTNLSHHPHISLWLGLSYAAKNDVSNAKFYFQKAISSGVEVPPEVYDYLESN